jgi:hypothetical protein
MREMEEREVVLTDCPPDALESVLRFCYMGECRLPRRDMLSLLVLADRLDIPDLTALAEKVCGRCSLCIWLFASGQFLMLRIRCSSCEGRP